MTAWKIRLTALIGFMILSIAFLSCDKATSIVEGDQYQQKDFQFKPLDTLACNYLSDTLATYIHPGQTYDLPGTWIKDPFVPNDNWVVFRDTVWTRVDTTTANKNKYLVSPTDTWIILPDSTYLPPIQDTTWVSGNYTLTAPPAEWNIFGDTSQLQSVRADLIKTLTQAITDSIAAADTIVVEPNRNNALLTPAGKGENVVLFTNQNAGKYLIYVSDYIDLRLYDPQGNLVPTVYNQIPLLSITACMDAKERQEYSLDPGKYLLQAVKVDQTLNDTLHVVLLNDSNN